MLFVLSLAVLSILSILLFLCRYFSRGFFVSQDAAGAAITVNELSMSPLSSLKSPNSSSDNSAFFVLLSRLLNDLPPSSLVNVHP